MASGDAKTGVTPIGPNIVAPWTGKGSFKSNDDAEKCCLSILAGNCATEFGLPYCSFQYYSKMRFELLNSTGICLDGIKYSKAYIPPVWTTTGVLYGLGGVSPDTADFPTALAGITIRTHIGYNCPESFNPSLTHPLYGWELAGVSIQQPPPVVAWQYYIGSEDTHPDWASFAFDPLSPYSYGMQKFTLCSNALFLPSKFKAVKIKIFDNFASLALIGTADLFISW